MFQSHWVEVINAPKKVQTKYGLCLTTKYQWVQLGLGQLDTNEDEIEWPNALGWQNFETLNLCCQTCQLGWSMVPLVRVVL